MQPLHHLVSPPRKSTVNHPNRFVRQPIIDYQRDQAEQRRTLLAVLVMCAGVGVAAFALWQARATRTVYVPVPMESVGAATRPVASAVNGVGVRNQAGFAPLAASAPPRVIAAPALPMTRATPPPVAAATPVDYAARDRQVADLKRRIEEIDEEIRRGRADPHWYGIVKNSTDTSRQQSSDTYLAQLDKQRTDLRRQKWALEGR